MFPNGVRRLTMMWTTTSVGWKIGLLPALELLVGAIRWPERPSHQDDWGCGAAAVEAGFEERQKLGVLGITLCLFSFYFDSTIRQDEKS